MLTDATSQQHKSQDPMRRSITNERTDKVISYRGCDSYPHHAVPTILAWIVVMMSVRFSSGTEVTSSSTSDCCLIIFSPLVDFHVPICRTPYTPSPVWLDQSDRYPTIHRVGQ